jgi:Bacteriophage head to tail connecting protein
MREYRDYILKRHGEMRGVRAIEEPHWREIAAVLRPDDRDFDAHTQRRRDDSPIFDTAPLLALDDFVGGMFSQATNPMNRWLELSSGDEELDKYQPVKQWLWRRTNQILASFAPGVSPFYAEMPDFYAHIGCFGWSGFYCEEVVGQGRFVDRAIPINESFIDTDADGTVNTYTREFNVTGWQGKRKWKGNLALDRLKDTDRVVIVHMVWPNDDYRPGALGPDGMPWCSGYASPDVKDFYVPGGYYEFPYGCPRWKRRSGRPYPTGPGHTARADTVMVNEMSRTNLVAAQFAAEPPLLADEKSRVLAGDIEPNVVLYGTMNQANGKPTLQTLDRHQNMPVSLAEAEQRRNTIRQVFRWGLTQLIAQRPQMTAEEFLGWKEEDLKLMGPGLVRVQNEGLSVIVARKFNILDRAGLFESDPPPPELAGKALGIKYTSPLSQMLKVASAKGAVQWVNTLLPVAQVRPDVLDNVDVDSYAIVVHDGFTSDPTLLTDPRKRDAARAQRAALQQQAQQLAMATQAADVHATMSHAEQAKTLANQRRAQ